MLGWLKKHFAGLLLAFLFSSVVLFVPPTSLTHKMGARPGLSSATAGEFPVSLAYETGVPVCEQTINRAPNPGFEDGIGCSNRWCEGKECTFQKCNTGHESTTSARIYAGAPREEECYFFTYIDEIPVESGRFYEYSAWVKADLLSGEAYVRITFWSRGVPPVWNYEGDGRTNSVTDTGERWEKVTGRAKAPADAEYARIEATVSKSAVGSARFDDIFLGLATCLDIGKSDDPPWVMPGGELAYTIVYTNTGREKAKNVEIIETYDYDVIFDGAEPPPTKSIHTWERPDPLHPGASDTIMVWVTVRNDALTWLVNSVEISSEEVVKSISVDELTRVYTETPGITILPPYQSGAAEPGHSTEYDLTVLNSGSFDGQVALEFCPSLCSTPIVTPSPPYSLPSGISMPVKIGLRMPPEAPCGVGDVTDITATLSCTQPGIDPIMATATLRTIVLSPVFLPMSMKDFDPRSCFKDGWEVEPNDTYGQATGLLCPGRQYSGCPDDEWDMFTIDVHANGEIVVDLTIDEPGTNVQLQLRDRNGKLLEYVDRSPHHIDHTDESGQYYICIYKESGHHCDRPYTLWATFPY